ncbi:MauE/DoxX family redox-associated membrane protein [Bacillales bacterium AN1005]
MEYLSTIINITISSVFFASFYMKAKAPVLLRCEIYSYHLIKVKHIKIVGYLFLLLELVISIIFIFDLFQWFKYLFCILLLLFFCVLILKKQKEEGKQVQSCNCFGEMKLLNKYPLIRNSILIIFLVLQFFLPNQDYILGYKFILLLMVILVVVYYDLYAHIKYRKDQVVV